MGGFHGTKYPLQRNLCAGLGPLRRKRRSIREKRQGHEDIQQAPYKREELLSREAHRPDVHGGLSPPLTKDQDQDNRESSRDKSWIKSKRRGRIDLSRIKGLEAKTRDYSRN